MHPTGADQVGFPNKETQFQKGKSGNPNGRPKGSVDIMKLVQKLLEEPGQLPAALQQTIRDRCGMDKKAVEAVFLSLLLEALQGDAKAAKELLDRGYGKIAEPIEVTGKDGKAIKTESSVQIYMPANGR
jgi:hypothetical protein